MKLRRNTQLWDHIPSIYDSYSNFNVQMNGLDHAVLKYLGLYLRPLLDTFFKDQ